MNDQHNDHCIERGWFLVNWLAAHRWRCSMLLALTLLTYISGRLI